MPLELFPEEDIFVEGLFDFFNNLDEAETAEWEAYILHCSKCKTASPNKKWIAKTTSQLQTVGIDDFVLFFNKTFKHLEAELRAIIKTGDPDFYFLSLQSINCLKGIFWSAGLFGEEQLAAKTEAIALLCYRRIRGYGSICSKLANGCLVALSMLTPDKAMARLSTFKHKIKSKNTQKLIGKLVTQIATEAGIKEEVLEEIAIDNYGLDHERKSIFLLGNSKAVFELDQTGRVGSYWIKSDGKIQKSVPAIVKRDFPDELKSFKEQIASIRSALPIQKQRIEKLYFEEREWDFNHWFKYYIDHPFVSIVAKRLIWEFVKDGQQAAAIYYNNTFVNNKNQEIKWIGDGCKVRLWHPIHHKSDTIFEWRELLADLAIQQPFKQAYREVYILTDAERKTNDYSNRFAAHILKQHQFASLCRVRDWSFGVRGEWYSDHPNKYVPYYKIKAEFWIDVDWDGDQADSGIFNYVFSDQVRFYQFDQQLELRQIPPLLFTEIMRDIDLFVGVCSIGNDPNWVEGDNERMNDYWQDYAFGDLSQTANTRKQVLEKLIPRLKIAPKCELDGKFLKVKGSIRSYKIHLGSGNILMSPNDQYLCIVPDAKQKTDKVFLPFEGDKMLSIILSKAFMLVNDSSIADATITSQINDL